MKFSSSLYLKSESQCTQFYNVFILKGGGGGRGGGGGFRPVILETFIIRYGLKGKARTSPDFFRLVLGPCTQFYPCEASEKKWGQTPKS